MGKGECEGGREGRKDEGRWREGDGRGVGRGVGSREGGREGGKEWRGTQGGREGGREGVERYARRETGREEEGGRKEMREGGRKRGREERREEQIRGERRERSGEKRGIAYDICKQEEQAEESICSRMTYQNRQRSSSSLCPFAAGPPGIWHRDQNFWHTSRSQVLQAPPDS